MASPQAVLETPLPAFVDLLYDVLEDASYLYPTIYLSVYLAHSLHFYGPHDASYAASRKVYLLRRPFIVARNQRNESGFPTGQ